MPTIIRERGWRLFFYADEGHEPIHVHARKAEAECKFWLLRPLADIEEVWAYNLTPRLEREVREIILDHFDLIVQSWDEFFGAADNEEN